MQRKLAIDRDLTQYIRSGLQDPFWKATIKNIGWQKTELEKNAIIENNILRNYGKRTV